jgi:hypothetical protein
MATLELQANHPVCSITLFEFERIAYNQEPHNPPDIYRRCHAVFFWTTLLCRKDKVFSCHYKPVFDSPRNTESAFNHDIRHIDELRKMA